MEQEYTPGARKPTVECACGEQNRIPTNKTKMVNCKGCGSPVKIEGKVIGGKLFSSRGRGPITG